MGDSNHDTTPAVRNAIQRFHERMAQLSVEKKMAADDDLADKVRRMADERDRLFHLASEMLSTILLERNKPFLPLEIRMIADTGWRPQIEAIGAGRELTPDELKVALEMSGIDMHRGYERLRAALAKHAATAGA